MLQLMLYFFTMIFTYFPQLLCFIGQKQHIVIKFSYFPKIGRLKFIFDCFDIWTFALFVVLYFYEFRAFGRFQVTIPRVFKMVLFTSSFPEFFPQNIHLEHNSSILRFPILAKQKRLGPHIEMLPGWSLLAGAVQFGRSFPVPAIWMHR